MALYRAMAIHQHRSGLPSARFVNTFHIESGAAVSAIDAEEIAEAVRDFYVVNPGGGAEDVADQFSDVVATTGHEVRVYPIDEATGINLGGDGEPPLWTEPFDHLGRDGLSRTGYPSEVAICLSYKNISAGSVPQARRRGRIYIGPIYAGIGVEAEHQTPRVQVGTRGFLIDAAQELVTRLATNGHQWMVYSRPFAGRFGAVKDNGDPKPDLPARPGNAYPINSFWVDDSFDIQRRRGEAPVARSVGDA